MIQKNEHIMQDGGEEKVQLPSLRQVTVFSAVDSE